MTRRTRIEYTTTHTMSEAQPRLSSTACSLMAGSPWGRNAWVAGFAVLAVLGALDICPRLDEGGISCVSPAFEVIASIAMAIVLLSVFMGLPGLLALGGLIFLAFDLLHLWRK